MFAMLATLLIVAGALCLYLAVGRSAFFGDENSATSWLESTTEEIFETTKEFLENTADEWLDRTGEWSVVEGTDSGY